MVRHRITTPALTPSIGKPHANPFWKARSNSKKQMLRYATPTGERPSQIEEQRFDRNTVVVAIEREPSSDTFTDKFFF